MGHRDTEVLVKLGSAYISMPGACMQLGSIPKAVDLWLHWSSELRDRSCFDKVLNSGLRKN